jgi:L,D-transpeptidase ErfK/SrfK
MKKISLTASLIFLFFSITMETLAERYLLDESIDNTVFGEVKTIIADERETLLDIARQHGFGYQDIKLINKDVDTWLPGDGQEIILPSKFILPVAPMKGIVLNIPEMRLYYYPKKEQGKLQEVHTYPLGVGREGWNTPYISTMIVEKKIKPNWYPPTSIREEHEEAGDPLPKIVRPGPDNPLGSYAMRLGRRDYLIHGTNKPYGIGMRISHGCIRLYPEDIEELFSKVSLETPVNIINQPYKIGIKNDVIYLEAHPFLDEDKDIFENNLTSIISMIIKISSEREYQLDMPSAYEAIKNPNGIPVPVGIFLSNLKEEENKSLVTKTEYLYIKKP